MKQHCVRTGIGKMFTRLSYRATRSRRESSDQYVVIAFLITLLLPEVVGSECRRRITQQLITYKNCVPKKLIMYSCSGFCVTHTQVAPTNPLALERTCYQCKESAVKRRKVKVKCPNPEGPAPFKSVLIEVPVPRECMCQSCSFDDVISLRKHRE